MFEQNFYSNVDITEHIIFNWNGEWMHGINIQILKCSKHRYLSSTLDWFSVSVFLKP